MIKLKSLLSEGTIACGECLTYAWKTAAKNYNNSNMKIVYGEVGNKWLSGGKRFKHAWVEDKGKVMDWQTMELGMSKFAKKGWPKSQFYKFYSPKDLNVYSPKEAIDNFRETKSIMGWDWK